MRNDIIGTDDLSGPLDEDQQIAATDDTTRPRLDEMLDLQPEDDMPARAKTKAGTDRRGRRGAADPIRAPELYINPHLSWLEFNRRILEEALDHGNPLLERVKFTAIFSSNLDEFFMVRVSGLKSLALSGDGSVDR